MTHGQLGMIYTVALTATLAMRRVRRESPLLRELWSACVWGYSAMVLYTFVRCLWLP